MSHAKRTEQHLPLTTLTHRLTNKQWIAAELKENLDRFLTANPSAQGELVNGRLRMPLSSTKGTCLTWEKALSKVVESIVNRPATVNDCWLVNYSSRDTSGYPLFQINNYTRYRTHRVIHCIYNPEEFNYVQERQLDRHLSHRCGRGRANDEGDTVCISPHHVVYHTVEQNQDHKGCKYGCRQLCPHSGFCIWTWKDTGLAKYCLNQPTLPAVCHCPRPCYRSQSSQVIDSRR